MKVALIGAVLAASVIACPALAGDEGDAKQAYSFDWRVPFADMSPQGVALIRDAMRREATPANAEEVRKARARVLELLSADRLDADAIRKAQAQERAVAIREHALAQEKLLKAYQQLSLADRRAFVEGMRLQEERIQKHMQRARDRMIQVEQQMRKQREQMRRDMERMQRQLVKDGKQTGSLWIVVPAPVAPPYPATVPAPPEVVAPPAEKRRG